MKELLSTVVKPLLHHPEELQIEESKEGKKIKLEVRVDPDDMGRIIGKGGKRANAIRSVMKAKGTIDGVRVVVDIVE
ncbi:MAG: KH domain-containing protein [Eubacteriales bacterium]|nr:KH domain-containing protein [Eubacteriales bacterium]MDD4323558.1 KH domain-containing protein [Eubacteriales bacterium]MDD4541563.1 KH domain-containing protein [Eubacteriales bacterium]